MTRRASGSGLRIPRLWVLPLGVLAAMLAGTASGVLSRSLILDLAAWWPVWVVIVVSTIVARGRRVGRLRASGLVPLVALAAVVAFLSGHLQGWSVMPSAEARLVGPPVDGISQAVLEVRLDGEIRLGDGSSFLYEVEPIRWGGGIALPEAAEERRPMGLDSTDLQPTSLVVVALEPRTDPGPYTFAGWDIRLSDAVQWTISMEGRIDADLSGLPVSSFDAVGGGLVVLGDAASSGAEVLLVGEFRLMVPEGVPVRIVGEAAVPPGWEEFGEGWRSPTPGVGWEVTVFQGSSVTVAER